MNKHLQLIREFHEKLAIAQAEHGKPVPLSEMNIIMCQSLLMTAGSEICTAIKAGDMVEILAGLVDLAYYALIPIAIQGSDVMQCPITGPQSGSIISLMRMVSEKINHCSSGNADDYAALYCLCVELSRSFINANFDKAFELIHNGNLSKQLVDNSAGNRFKAEISRFQLPKAVDLSDCLYE